MTRYSLRIRLDEAFDGASWPGPLGDCSGDAVFGRAWLGPRGLLRLLETQLGLVDPQHTRAERVAALVPRLAERVAAGQPHYARSFAADPIGTAERLLDQRDRLAQGGFSGASEQRVSPRLAELAVATERVLPGEFDRWLDVRAALAKRPADIARVVLTEELVSQPWVLRRVLAELAEQGCELVVRPSAHAAPTGDLSRARSGAGALVGDGSLRLLRPHGPLAAAEALAGWLATLSSRTGIVVIGGDALLDGALAESGLPTLGAGRENVLLSVLPLCLELAWQPADPELAQQLLLVPDGPVPQRAAASLVRALARWPAVDSEAWRAAKERALTRVDDPRRRADLAATLEQIFETPVSRSGPYPRAELEARIGCVERWARRHAHAEERAPRAGAFFAVIEQCRRFRRVLQLLERESLSAPELARVRQLCREKAPRLGGPAEAGLVAIDRPDAIVGPARAVVWWNFSRESAPRPSLLGVSAREQSALDAAGVELADSGSEALRLAARWARPLYCAEEQLVFVCPRRAANGEEQAPHPLWDEIEARCGSAKALVTGALIERQRATLSPPPQARRHFALSSGEPGPVSTPTLRPRELESPSSLARLCGCPLSWVLFYAARLAPGLSAPVGGFDGRRAGMLAHEVLQALFEEAAAAGEAGIGAPEHAAAQAEALFERLGPRRVAWLFLPGHEADRGDTRQRLSLAVQVLAQHLRGAGAQVRSAEQIFETSGPSSRLGGRPDLVLAAPKVVIDFKWGGRKRHEDALVSGTALQLAAYAWLVRDETVLPAVAYYVLRSQDLLVLGSDAFDGVTPLASVVRPADTLRALFGAAKSRWEQLAAGEVAAPGVADGGRQAKLEETALVDGELSVSPPCGFCDFDGICGRGLAPRGA